MTKTVRRAHPPGPNATPSEHLAWRRWLALYAQRKNRQRRKQSRQGGSE